MKKISKGINKVNWKYQIGETISIDEWKIKIIGRGYHYDRDKKNHGRYYYYKYKCLTCGYLGKKKKTVLENKNDKCPCCHGDICVPGINDVATVDPWMIKFFQNGIVDARQYTSGSKKMIYPICPDCKSVRNKPISIKTIHSHGGIYCPCNTSGYSYPEKFIYSFLQQLNVNFSYQCGSNYFSWINKEKERIYDFHIHEPSLIIETHGDGHYGKGFNTCKGTCRTLEEEQENDIYKQNLAYENGYNDNTYIVLDCRQSNIYGMRKSIMSSKLPTILNFSINDIDWIKCGIFASSNKIKEICDYRNEHPELSSRQVALHYNMGKATIQRYWKIGNENLWCYYDAELAKGIHRIKLIAPNNETIGIYSDLTKAYYAFLKHSNINISLCTFRRNCNKECYGYNIQKISETEYYQYMRQQQLLKEVS